jgi:hypothetical protein
LFGQASRTDAIASENHTTHQPSVSFGLDLVRILAENPEVNCEHGSNEHEEAAHARSGNDFAELAQSFSECGPEVPQEKRDSLKSPGGDRP